MADAVPSLKRPALAATATGSVIAAAVVGGTHLLPESAASAATGHSRSAAPGHTRSAAPALDRAGSAPQVSRSGQRPPLQSLKRTAIRSDRTTVARHAGDAKSSKNLLAASSDPRTIAKALLAQYGWPASEFTCLDDLWVGESDWNPGATNPYSGAYGIPQALPAEKMATVGPDWRTDPATQIRWGLDYIRSSYGSPCSADAFKQGNGWY
ncbi:MAG: lytic transglycosylase domain-containing protein [Nocardioidaceae bacterium]